MKKGGPIEEYKIAIIGNVTVMSGNITLQSLTLFVKYFFRIRREWLISRVCQKS